MPSDPTQSLLFETSPFGTIDAIVEHDGRVVYFYLNEHPDSHGKTAGKFGTRACWVRNLIQGPLVMDQSEAASGLAPLMPRNDCIDQEERTTPDPDHLQIVWFEEGNGAALLELDGESGARTIAVIPPWSGMDGFFGYALNCAHETPLAWPMPVHAALELRIDRAIKFWSSFTSEGSPFADLQAEVVARYDKCFGKENQKQYYSIDGGNFPPRGLVRYETRSETILVSVGMSLCPQPAVELSVEQPSEHRRIEIGTKVTHVDSGPDAEKVEAAMRSLSTWAGYPWRNQSWLGHGHTIDFSELGKARLVRDNEIESLNFRSDPVRLLWIDTDVEA